MKTTIAILVLSLMGVAFAIQGFAAAGGWGFQRFVKNTTELAEAPTPQQCFAYHDNLKKDGLILSQYRP